MIRAKPNIYFPLDYVNTKEVIIYKIIYWILQDIYKKSHTFNDNIKILQIALTNKFIFLEINKQAFRQIVKDSIRS